MPAGGGGPPPDPGRAGGGPVRRETAPKQRSRYNGGHHLRAAAGFPRTARAGGLRYEPCDRYSNLARGVPRQQEPGEKASCFNTNYILLGMIIERLTGHTLADELDRRLFTPLGMHRTYLPTKPPEGIRGPRNHGYLPDEQGRLHDVDRINASHLWAAGGVVSTAEEVSAFHRAYTQGKLLPPRLQEVIDGRKRPGPPDGERLCGGLFELREIVGGAPGFHAPTYVSADGRRQFAMSVTLSVRNDGVRPMVGKAAEAVLCPGR
ncbi:beta-lactamase family protein [Nonomuraea sp. KC401]|uniref:serine hydrolase domain-containing protein n=1 Tax=unclassified Nonomuraea TaxID=2593643 RepID=UPI0010FEA87F|nr:serine hydrolase domain-containing protein [Nonomuraea sp. K271]TLF85682.1 beta-lactamase family protein [Nonomuraea sp. KC401]